MSLRLSQAQLKGVARREALKDVKLIGHRYNRGRAFVHTGMGRAEIHRTSQDAIIITDAQGGYIPFSISGLTDLMKKAKRLPIPSEGITL